MKSRVELWAVKWNWYYSEFQARHVTTLLNRTCSRSFTMFAHR